MKKIITEKEFKIAVLRICLNKILLDNIKKKLKNQ